MKIQNSSVDIKKVLDLILNFQVYFVEYRFSNAVIQKNLSKKLKVLILIIVPFNKNFLFHSKHFY